MKQLSNHRANAEWQPSIFRQYMKLLRSKSVYIERSKAKDLQKLYKTNRQPTIVTYGSESWTMRQANRENIGF